MRVLLMMLAVAAMSVLPAAAQQKSQPPSPSTSSKPSSSKAAPAAKRAAVPAGPINLNTATQAQLETLPGIGAKGAERILEYRQKNGTFKKPEDLMNVKGIGEKAFLKLKPYLTVSDRAEKTEI
jgi:competence protein ComEA